MHYPTTSLAIRAFFSDPDIRSNHNDPGLLDRYNPDMEVQVNVAPDGGEPVQGKRNTWTDPEDSLADEWHHIRIPKNAKDDPQRNDWPLKYELAKHVEAIGCTGFDFGMLRSRWFGFDFDSIIGHAAGVGVSDAELTAVKAAAWEIPWIEIRKSTGGGGLHLYAMLCEDGIPVANHTEHAALGRAVLELMSNITGFAFAAKVDVCGGNMWIWHRKSSLSNEGLKLLKAATARLSPSDIPGDWRSHLAVVQKKRATQRVIGIPEEANDSFDNLVSSRRRVPFTPEHRRILDALPSGGFTMIYQRDNHLVQVHTARLAQLAADSTMGVRGIFKTLSVGTDPGKPNAFMFPLENGGWRVYRFSPGTKEASTWEQGDGWTTCDFNVRSTIEVAVRAEGGQECSDGSYVFESALQGFAALNGMGTQVTAPDWAADRNITIKQHKSPRKLTVILKFQEDDENPKSKADMRDHGWNLEGKRADHRRWTQVVKLPSTDSADKAQELLGHCDTIIRSVKTADGQDAGWRLLDSDQVWVQRDRTAAGDMLCRLGVPNAAHRIALAELQARNWTLQNLPFQPEFPGGRIWNIGAQLEYVPTSDDRSLAHPHWDAILQHVGKGLDDAVRNDDWCQVNGVANGADYLLHWAASLFQQPSQKLPYLFFYGEQETGKSSFHNSLGLLMSRGHVEARNSLLTTFNGELDGAILAYVEEVDLSGKASEAYNRLKDLVTADSITINAKYSPCYSSVSHLHWIQVSNDRRFCPIFENDTRIVVIHVAEKPAIDIAWPKLKKALQAEAADFLRTLRDLRLPEGTGRLWLPVLDTQAKREAVAETKAAATTGGVFDQQALENAIRRLLLAEGDGIFKGLVSKLHSELGKGPWSEDLNIFGQQLRHLLKDSIVRGIRSVTKRRSNGNYVELEESWTESNMDGLAEIAALMLADDFIRQETTRRTLPAPHCCSVADDDARRSTPTFVGRQSRT